MTTFAGLEPAQDFIGTDGVIDTVSYLRDSGGVTVNVTTGGTAGFADGDTYQSIERFLLTRGSGIDHFTGGAGNEIVYGYSGYNFLDGGAGNDYLYGGNDGNTLTGGAGADTVTGGDGTDIFNIASGDLVAGDRLVGGAGSDSIVLTGTGGSFDLSAANYYHMEEIRFDSGASGTLIVTNNADQAITHGDTALGQNVHVTNWIGGNSHETNGEALLIGALTYLGNGIDQVSWTGDIGDYVAAIDPVSGQASVTLVNNGATSRDYQTTSWLFDFTGALEQEMTWFDTDILWHADYDTGGGPGNETLLSESFFDYSFDGNAEDYEVMFLNYAAGGVIDGILDYSLTQYDNGLQLEEAFTGGVLQIQTYTDISLDGSAFDYEWREIYYRADGSLLGSYTLYDDASTVQVEHDANGDEVLRVTISADDITQTITTTPADGSYTTQWQGNGGDNVITGNDDDAIFLTGAGADLNIGGAGNDIFTLSATETDGNWGAGTYSYAEQAALSSGMRVSVALEGLVQITDVLSGGAGTNSLIGSSLGEVVLLYDPISEINPALSISAPRIAGISVFDMGGGNDVVNLTAAADQTEYMIDSLIEGGTGDDYLFGGAGNDTIIGGDGMDRLIGWKGDDVLTGGGGVLSDEEDRFLFASDSSAGNDIITDFEVNTDVIFVIGYGVSSLSAALSSGVASTTDAGTDTILTLDNGTDITTITLSGVTLASLDADDFAFFA